LDFLDFLDFFFSFLDFFFGLTLSSLDSSESDSAFFSGTTASLTSTFLLTRTSFSSGFGAMMLLFSSETKYLTHD
jgi:hypothetical protein